MKKRNANKFLLLILLILVIVTTTVIVLYLNYNDTTIDEKLDQSTETEELKYDNSETSYYDYLKGGLLDIDTNQYVKLPENYSEYKITSKTKEEINAILNIIIENSEVEIPVKLLNGYYGDVYNSAKVGAEIENKTIDEYIKEIYGYDNYQKYIEENTEYFKSEIKKDMVYHALAKNLNITITRDDVESYFSERLQNGNTYESLVELYGEKLMYKYTMQDKIEKTLTERLSK